MPVNSIPVYKELIFLGLEPYKIPVLFSGTTIICEPKFLVNDFIKGFAGHLIPSVNIVGIDDVLGAWRRTWINSKQFISFSIPYFPSTYELSFKAGSFLRGKEFQLNIWELT